MKIVALTPLGTFESRDEPVNPLDRAVTERRLLNMMDGCRQFSMVGPDGETIVLPAAVAAQSLFVIEGLRPVEGD